MPGHSHFYNGKCEECCPFRACRVPTRSNRRYYYPLSRGNHASDSLVYRDTGACLITRCRGGQRKDLFSTTRPPLVVAGKKHPSHHHHRRRRLTVVHPPHHIHAHGNHKPFGRGPPHSDIKISSTRCRLHQDFIKFMSYTSVKSLREGTFSNNKHICEAF